MINTKYQALYATKLRMEVSMFSSGAVVIDAIRVNM